MNLILCGFMGCGKTTVGKVLAEKLGRTFMDTDTLIEERAGIRISEIFDREGEAHFRDLEHQACVLLSEQDNLVISTGGGALTYERNARALKKNGAVIFLDVPFDIIVKRIGGDAGRPLFRSEPDARALYEHRYSLYKKNAGYTVDASGTPGDTANEIIKNILK